LKHGAVDFSPKYFTIRKLSAHAESALAVTAVLLVFEYLLNKHARNVHAAELKAVGIAIVQGKINTRTCI